MKHKKIEINPGMFDDEMTEISEQHLDHKAHSKKDVHQAAEVLRTRERTIEELASEILKHKKLYYQGKSVLLDEAFDALEEQLKILSPDHPVLSMVGYSIENKKVKHRTPLRSLSKTYDVGELFSFVKGEQCLVSDKVDGMAISIHYDKKGCFQKAVTRGDGQFGEEVTEALFHVTKIPKKIEIGSLDVEYLEVRGELFFPSSEFIRFQDQFDSYRNAVAGTLARKEVEGSFEILKALDFFAYDLILSIEGSKEEEIRKEFSFLNSFFERLKFLESRGFFMGSCTKVFECHNEESLQKLVDSVWSQQRDYEIDGLVFRINEVEKWTLLGSTSHHPRGSLAFKKHGESKVTKLVAIHTQVGRTGKVAFRAELEPIALSGATITHATLHNAEFIEKGGYAPGCQVEVKRSGEVIPYIVRLVEPSPNVYPLPHQCPCGFDLQRQNSDLYCMEKKQCQIRSVESLIHFVSAMEMQGISEKIVKKLFEYGLISDPASLFDLSEVELLKLPGFKEKASKNVIHAIQSQRHVPLSKLLFALGLKRVGLVKCREIAMNFKSLDEIQLLQEEDLLKEKGWSHKSAHDFLSSLKEKKGIIDKLLEFVMIEPEVEMISQGPLSGLVFCVTGALSKSRQEFVQLIESKGGSFSPQITNRVQYLICNETSQSKKYQEAMAYGVKIIKEEEFFALL